MLVAVPDEYFLQFPAEGVSDPRTNQADVQEDYSKGVVRQRRRLDELYVLIRVRVKLSNGSHFVQFSFACAQQHNAVNAAKYYYSLIPVSSCKLR